MISECIGLAAKLCRRITRCIGGLCKVRCRGAFMKCVSSFTVENLWKMVVTYGAVAAFIFIVLLPCGLASLGLDRQALLGFMEKADLEHVLITNWTGSNPCSPGWDGVGCASNRVQRLELERRNLTGTVPLNSLGQLTELRVLSLKKNRLTGTIPSDLSNCINLKKVFLSFNQLEGPIPNLLSLQRLDRLDLSNNRLTGTIPTALGQLKKLLTLRLEVNSLSGRLPDLSGLRELTNFNVSWNKFSGPIPASLANKDRTSFTGNVDLCGRPLSANCTDSPSKSDGLSKQVMAIIVISACIALVATVSGVFCCYRYRLSCGRTRQALVVEHAKPKENKVKASSDLVFVRKDDSSAYELMDLFQASAVLLGKGILGSTYRAVCRGGLAVVVKRLVDKTGCSKKVFERRMAVVGRVTHPNLLPLRAYYFYGKLEKLLVYDYMPRGNLQDVLHGASWSMRLHIADGLAKCMRFLHQECKLPHGSIKSSNVLLSDRYETRVCDFGLLSFMPVGESSPYRAPECRSSADVTRKADVYSFGVVLLELLTGKRPQVEAPGSSSREGRRMEEDNLPSWVTSTADEDQACGVFDKDLGSASQEEMAALLKIALACLSREPVQRPKMNEVVRMIEDIYAMASSPR